VPRRGSLIDLDDLSDAAAKVIREGKDHYFASYELVGPDKLTALEVAEIPRSLVAPGSNHRGSSGGEKIDVR
jgi:hypothetical protein